MTGWYEISTVNDGRWYVFNLKAESGDTLLQSDFCETLAAAEEAVSLAQLNSPLDTRYERLPTVEGRIHFKLTGPAEQLIGTSGVFDSEQARDAGIALIKLNGPTRDIRNNT
jgi:uncharacterized protein YegP (UPF0339 family)